MSTEVSTTEYRARLREWHERVRHGEDLIVTDNGQPTVRVVAAGGDAWLERLEREGLLRRGRARRPSAAVERQSAPGDSSGEVSRGRDR